MNYAHMSVADLLAALEEAGKQLPESLIRACMAKRIEIRKPLLEMFSQALDEELQGEIVDADSPRTYRVIHAGLLLIALRETAALPFLGMIYGDETLEWLVEWFEDAPSHYGPPAIPTFLEVLRSLPTSDWHYGRGASAEILEQIALAHPTARTQVIEELRALLPPLDPDGELPWDEDVDPVDGNWADIVSALGVLQDQASKPTILAMFINGLINEEILDEDDYFALLNGLLPDPRPRFDILKFYASLTPSAQA
jgi:hypothetical protein